MKKNILMMSVIALCFNEICESRAECIGADLDTVGINEKGNPCGICGSNCNWVVENNALNITGGTDGTTGHMKSYNLSDTNGGTYAYLTTAPWKDIEINAVDIKNVENVGDFAFIGLGITSASMDNTINRIGTDSFHSNALININLPDSVTIIDFGAFAASNRGNNLESIVLPDSLTTIGDQALLVHGNSDFPIIVPDTVTTVGLRPFQQNAKIICKGSESSCQGLKTLLSKYCPSAYGCTEDSYIDLSGNLFIAGPNECSSTNYFWNGAECVRQPDKSKRFCCSGCKFDSGRCWRVHYTPAELAKIVGKSNTILLYYK